MKNSALRITYLSLIFTRIIYLSLILLPAAVSKAAVFEESFRSGDTELRLVGTGSFRYLLFKLYDGALYMAPGADRTAPLADVPKRLELLYSRTITAAQLVESGSKILAKNVDSETFADLDPQLEMINAAYQDVHEGDRYALTYIPGRGTSLELNGVEKVLVPGADFAAAYFTIWLGENSAKRSFRAALLGK